MIYNGLARTAIGYVKVVIGVPAELKPLLNAPAGRRRFRFRNTGIATVTIKEPDGARRYVLTDLGDKWGLLLQGRNLRREGSSE
jgi:hypothetical protein